VDEIKVPAKVHEQIQAVRRTGATNMCDRRTVQVIADRLDFYDLVCWIEEHPKEYVRGISRGFEVVPG